METTVNQRIQMIADEKCEGNISELARLINVKQPSLRDIVGSKKARPGFETINSIVENSTLNIDANWLITGHGNMTKNLEVQKIHNPKFKERLHEEETVPLYDVEAAANLSMTMYKNEEQIIGFISIPNMPSVDGAIAVRGDSMYPIIKSGDVIVYKWVSSPEYLTYGEMYLLKYIWDDDIHVTVKYVNKSDKDGYIKLVSHNSHHEPMDIPISAIQAVALVKVSIRYNTL